MFLPCNCESDVLLVKYGRWCCNKRVWLQLLIVLVDFQIEIRIFYLLKKRKVSFSITNIMMHCTYVAVKAVCLLIKQIGQLHATLVSRKYILGETLGNLMILQK